ncbi:hypothetical protein [Modicisalibacter sp. 'Wilcox']|uniref:hypothetical protein n=1 Tax=Modicisalibacter sp. 'Wilcox' TaxID=2679914 RepID=UPI0013D2ACAC|nr:hypothetical protein [Modicisalibacter sp. 'Wilcox']
MPYADDDNARSPFLNLLIIVTLVTMVVAVGYLAHYYLRGGSNDVVWYPPDGICRLHQGPCHAGLGGDVRVTLSLGSAVVPLHPLPLDVHVDGLSPERVVVAFIGRNRNMGLRRYVLQDRGDGDFHGEGVLSVNSVDDESVTRWRAEVIVTTPEGRRGSWFDFDVHRPGAGNGA